LFEVYHFMTHYLRTALLVSLLCISQAYAQQESKPALGERNKKDFLGYYHESRRYQDIIGRGAFVVNLPEEGRFLVFFIPSERSADNVMVLLHGTGGTAYDEIADEIEMAAMYGYALMGVQWLDKKTGTYDSALKINRMIDKGLRFLQKEYGSRIRNVALCGFSRGSAISYEVAYLDKNSHRYFNLVIAHSGGIPFDNVVARGESNQPDKFFSELTSGQLGQGCLSGIAFYLYAGEQDEQWGSRMAEYMQYTAEVITKNGGKVVRLIIDPDGRHAGYRLTKDYHEQAVKYFLK
ncbi:MAG: hypothetical protein PHR11_03310, partial [Candidatus Omnitrophica bacterium]|nr:hypothetical protein [Candidatus Omnitrophota bacterium]